MLEKGTVYFSIFWWDIIKQEKIYKYNYNIFTINLTINTTCLIPRLKILKNKDSISILYPLKSPNFSWS